MVLNHYTADYLTSILSAVKDLVFLLDDAGHIRDFFQTEHAEWLYVPKDQFIGKHHRAVLPPDVCDKIENALSDIRQGRSTSAFDYRISIGGTPLWFTAIISPLRTVGTVTPNYLCVIREITARKEKELLLQNVLDNAFNAFIVLRAIRDPENVIVDFEWLMINPKAEQMLGQSAVNLVGKRLKGSHDHPWLLFDDYVKVAETEKALDLQYSSFTRGTKAWLHTHVSAFDGKLLITIRDITEEVQAFQDLRAATEQLRYTQMGLDMFFSQALSGFFFMTMEQPIEWNESTDKEAALEYAVNHLRFSRVNDALLQQYGARREEFMQLTLKDFFKGDLGSAKRLLRNLYDEGRMFINRQTRKLDGSELWVEGNYICFTDGANRILGHFGIQHDVTNRKRGEDALKASEERYRLLANNMLDLVALHDPDGTYRYISPSVTKVLGYTPEELLHTNPYRLFHPDDIASIREQSHARAIEGMDIADMQYRIRRKDGAYIWFSTNTKPITDAAGTVTMLQTVSRDITDRIHTLHLLEERDHQKNKLFSIIAHDLRGPLASCMGLLDLMERASAPHDREKYIALARKSAFNLHELMEDLLLWAGSQLDKIAFDPLIINVKEEIENLSRKARDVAERKGICLEVGVTDEDLSVFADREMLRAIVRNLLSNAIKFTRTGGHVQITAASNKEGMVLISVTDDGVGIASEDQEKLFSRVSTHTTYGTAGEKGTGLGLDICKDFVDKHGGQIWVESEPGRGSKFTFTLKEF